MRTKSPAQYRKMSTESDANVGELVQAHIRAKWGDGARRPDNARLTPALRERVDALGFDCERLLDVAADEVLDRLSALEREATQEDARALGAAASVHAREQNAIDRRAQGHVPTTGNDSQQRRTRGGHRRGRKGR